MAVVQCLALFAPGPSEANRHRSLPPGAPQIVPGVPGAVTLPADFRGDPGRGRLSFQSRRCPACHSVDGRPGSPGPDLSRVGETRNDTEWYRKYLQDPRSVFSESIAPSLRVPKEELDDLIAYLLTLRKFR